MTPIILDIEDIVHGYMAECAAEEIPAIPEESFTKYVDPDFEYLKCACNDARKIPTWTGRLIEHLQSDVFIGRVEKWTGISGLARDDSLWGGGVHVTLPGGYLAMHRDFNVLPTSYRDEVQMRRAVNLIMYLTPGWEPSWGGELHIEGHPSIEPWFGSTAIFDPSETFHGHPYPYMGKVPRQSIAVYYYVREKVPQSQWRSTQYLPLPWRDDTPDAKRKRAERADARKRYAKWWPQGWDGNGSPA